MPTVRFDAWHRAPGAYQLEWFSPDAALPPGDALVVDTSRAAPPWPALADVLIHPVPTAPSEASAVLRALWSATNAAIIVLALDTGGWLVHNRGAGVTVPPFEIG